MSRKLHEDKAEYAAGSETQTKIPAPNYTQIPNVLIALMPEMGEAELKVTLAIARKTFGWHKDRDKLSLSQLMDLTGLSRQGVINGIADGMKRGTIARTESGDSFDYYLVVNEMDQSAEASQPNRPEVVHEIDTQKKEKEINNNDNNAPEPYVNWQTELQASCFGIDPQTFRDILDAWKEKPDPRRHLEAMRQMKAGHQMSARIYLKAYLNFNPDYVPPAASSPPRATHAGRKPPVQPYRAPTPEEKEQFRRELAQRQAEWSKG